jgi:hypothetical protein
MWLVIFVSCRAISSLRRIFEQRAPTRSQAEQAFRKRAGSATAEVVTRTVEIITIFGIRSERGNILQSGWEAKGLHVRILRQGGIVGKAPFHFRVGNKWQAPP